MGTTSFDSYFTGLGARLRTRITALIAVLAMTASGGAMVLAPARAGASPTLPLLDGVQMDGNTTVEPATPGTPTAWGASVDWNSLLGACTNQSGAPFTALNPASAQVAGQQPKCPSDVVWVKDFYTTSGADDAFTLGSKDILDPNDAAGTAQWNWVNFQTPDKNDLTDVFATVKDDNLYVGANRYATNGDAYIGFWLFKRSIASKCTTSDGKRIFVDSKVGATGSPVTCVADAGNPGGVTGTYPRLRHSVGDLLILINYTNGGSKTNAQVYTWDPANPNASNNLVPQTFSTDDDCVKSVPTNADQFDACSTTNFSPTSFPVTWGYTPKSGSPNTAQAGGFFEAAIDLTASLPGRDTCFSSIIGETRSSDSTTAELKDFAGGAFTPCSIKVDKTGPSIGKVGADPADLLNYTVTVTNDGSVTLYRKSINDSIAGNLLGTPNAGISNVVNNCGASLAPGASCTITYSYQAKSTDPDPLPNAVTIFYNAASDLSGSDVTAADSHSVNLFQPAVGIDKTCDAITKVGDPYTCSVTVTNTGSSDSPASVFDSLTDSKAGNLLGTANVGTTITANACKTAGIPVTLLPGASCTVTYDRVTLVSDSDPIINTATVHMHPTGFPNDLTDDDQASIDVFQPGISLEKTCDGLSKVGDPLSCSVTVTNTSSSGTPNLILDSISDTIVGNLNGTLTRGTKDTCPAFPVAGLAVGASWSCSYHFTVLVTDPDPLENTATVHTHPAGFPNDIWDDDTATTNLFQPAIGVAKSCDDLSKIGDDVFCTVTVTNSGSSDSPNLVLDTISDTVVGNLNGTLSRGTKTVCPAFPVAGLAVGANWSCTYKFTVVSGDPDPIVNTVTVHTHPAGFPNDIYGSDSETINLFQPSLSVDKTCDALSKATDDANCTVTVTNTGSSDSPVLGFDQDVAKGLTDTVVGDLLGANGPLSRGTKLATSTCFRATTLAVGASCKVDYKFTVLLTDSDPIVNTASAWMHPAGFPNDIKGSDSASINLFQPSLTVEKTCDPVSKVGDDVDCSVVVTNTSSSDSPNLIVDTVTDTLVGNLLGTLTRGTKVSCPAWPGSGLAPTATWTCTYRFTVLVTDVIGTGENKRVENTAIVHTHPSGFPNDIYGTDSAVIKIFTPSLSITKVANPTTVVDGSTVTYTVTVTNTTPESYAPKLYFDSDTTKRLKDSLAGDLLGTLTRGTRTGGTCLSSTQLAGGESCTVIYTLVVTSADPNPLNNTVSTLMHPVGFPNPITGTANASVSHFTPTIGVDKTCDPLSKVGDDVSCTVTVTNTSPVGTPNATFDSDTTKRLKDSVVGDLLGTLSRGTRTGGTCTSASSLAANGGSCTVAYTFTVLATDPDPIVNTVSALMHPVGFPATNLTGTDNASINLFQPSLSVDKQGSITTGLVGDTVTYTVTVTNTGSPDNPGLTFDADPAKGLVDTKAGDLLRTLNAGYTLVSRTCTTSTILGVSGSCNVVFSHVLTAADTNPLVNVASAWMHPVGFPNDIKGSDDWSVSIKNPDFTITKQCVGGNVPIGGTAIFDITVTNTGDVTLTIKVTDTEAVSAKLNGGSVNLAAGYDLTLAAGASATFTDVAEIVTVANITPDGYVINHVVGTTTYGSKTITKEADARCKIDQGATRTPGFWQTHVSYTTHIFRDALGSHIDLGWRQLTTKEQVFGMFWASNSRQSNGSRRDSVCQARVIGSFQLLAAILNTGLSNGAAVPIDTVTGNSIIVAMRAALTTGNVTEIKRLQGLLDAYNNSGDAIAIVDNWGTLPGNASPTTAKSIADVTIADC